MWANPIWETVFRWSTLSAAFFGGIGIVAAFISAWVGYEITGATQRESDQKIAEANERAASAELKSVEATLELAKFKAPRFLVSEQLAAIIKASSPFKGVPYDFSIEMSQECID